MMSEAPQPGAFFFGSTMTEDDNLTPDTGAEVLVNGEPSEAAAKATSADATANKDDTASPDTGAKDEGDTGGDEAAGEKKSKPGSAKLKEKVQRLEAEIAALRSQKAGAPKPDAIPKLEDFEFDTDRYEAAKAVYAAKQVAEQIKAQTTEDRVGSLENERAAAIIGAHQARIAEAKERIPEFDTVLAKAKAIPVTEDVNRAVLESEKSALLLHHLATRPADVAELNQMTPVQLARRIGQIEARLSYPTARTQSNAPPPVGGLRGGSAPSFDPATASHEEMKALFARK
jgi:hypothetical protein